MTSPNEPGPGRAGEGSVSTGSSEHGDVPPWQRGAARGRPPQRPGEGPAGAPGPAADAGRAGSSAGHSPGGPGASGADARLNRFMSGGPSGSGPAPTREAEAPAAGTRTESNRSDSNRPETGRSESYASELPDLSGPGSRPPQRKPSGERPAPEPASRPPRASANRAQAGPVRASMQVRRFDPWSVLKVSLVLSVALFFVWMIAVAFLYLVLGGMGVWSKLNSNVGDLLTSASGGGGELVSSSTIFGGAALVGLMNIVLLTAMATCGAFIYNLTTDIVGGIEVTLADRD